LSEFALILEVCRMFAQMKHAFILFLLILTVSATRAVEIAFPEISYWIPDGMKEVDEQEVNMTAKGSIIECRIFYDVLAPGNRILTVVSYINIAKEEWVNLAQLEAYSKQSSAALIHNAQVEINRKFAGYAVTGAQIDLPKQQSIVDYSVREGGIDYKGTVVFSPLSNNSVFTIFVSINTPALSGTMQQILDSLRINPDYKLAP
jgi:hypothetical protein